MQDGINPAGTINTAIPKLLIYTPLLTASQGRKAERTRDCFLVNTRKCRRLGFPKVDLALAVSRARRPGESQATQIGLGDVRLRMEPSRQDAYLSSPP